MESSSSALPWLVPSVIVAALAIGALIFKAGGWYAGSMGISTRSANSCMRSAPTSRGFWPVSRPHRSPGIAPSA